MAQNHYEKLAGLLLFGMVIAFISPIFAVFLGAAAGWIVGLCFEEEIMGFLSRIGVETVDMSMWQLGAALGFIGGFLKTTVHERKS